MTAHERRPSERRVIGSRIVVESERAARSGRGGVIAQVVHPLMPSYRVLWDDGHTSIVTPASGCARIEQASVDDDQAFFRSVNDRIRRLGSSWLGVYDFICECGDASCAQVVRMSAREYDELRAEDGQFGVAPGHEPPDGHVVARAPGYVVVTRIMQ